MEVILASVRSSYNVGSIFRTADAAGFEKIYLAGITPAPLDKFKRPNREIAKTALGAQNYLPWEKVKSAVNLIKRLKSGGYAILAIEQHSKSILYTKYKIPNTKTVLVLGSEVSGLPASILKLSDKILEIPMRGKKESLNVAVAFGIVAFSLINNKKPSHPEVLRRI